MKINFDKSVEFLSSANKYWFDADFTFLEKDFETGCDLFIACIVLQKQIDKINGKKENIVIPNVEMKMIREHQEGI